MPAPTQEETFRPIFVVGFPRSGTTLLATLLGRHSRLAAPPETRFVVAWDNHGGGRRTFVRHADLLDFVLATNQHLRDVELDRAALLAAFERGPSTPQHLFRLMLEQYAAQKDKARVVEKSPGHALYLPLLRSWFPAARFIYIARDPRASIHSMMQVPWAHDHALLHAAEWRYRTRCSLDDLARYGDDVMCLVHYEALVRQPERELTRLGAFIGEPFEPAQLAPAAAAAVPVGTVPEWERAWKQKAARTLDASRIDAWQGEMPCRRQQWITALLAPTAAGLDYALAEEPLPLHVRLLGHGVLRPLGGGLYGILRKRKKQVRRLLHTLKLSMPFSRKQKLESLRMKAASSD